MFLAFSYLAYLALFIQVKYIGSDMMTYIGIAVGAIFITVGVIYMVIYAKAETYFTEFKDKFHK